MKPFTCPICGGHLEIKIDSNIATCDSCGSPTEIDAADVERFHTIYNSAERAIRRNTVTGYTDAIRQLRPIAFIEEAKERIAFCEQQLGEKQMTRLRVEETQKTAEKKNAGLGIVLLILILLFCGAAIAGAVYLIMQLVKGELSSTAVTVLLIILAAVVALAVIGKVRSSGNGGANQGK